MWNEYFSHSCPLFYVLLNKNKFRADKNAQLS